MSSYYYLIASLPMLFFEGEPPISILEFRETCSYLMKEQDFRTIQYTLLNASSKKQVANPIVLRWQKFENGLRNEIARLRAKEKGKDEESYIKPGYSNPLLALKAREIFEAENPLKAEMFFIQMLWDMCDELEASQIFNLEFLIIYHLRLQILERKNSFNAEKGRQNVESIVTGELCNE
jgi:hypothetical protein